MTTQQLDRWAERLASGEVELANIERISPVPFEQLLTRIASEFPYRMLDRRLRRRREIGVAKSHRQNVSGGRGGTVTHHFANCLLLNSESGVLTGLTIMSKIRCRRTTNQNFEIVSGSGLSIVHSPEGWVLAALPERTVVLDESLLSKRGWHLDAA